MSEEKKEIIVIGANPFLLDQHKDKQFLVVDEPEKLGLHLIPLIKAIEDELIPDGIIRSFNRSNLDVNKAHYDTVNHIITLDEDEALVKIKTYKGILDFKEPIKITAPPKEAKIVYLGEKNKTNKERKSSNKKYVKRKKAKNGRK